MKYDISREYRNIDHYSPFSHINEVSNQYQKDSFFLPFVLRFCENRPVHPDTFKDLNLNPADIKFSKLVYPTSSFRTVYEPEENVFYKLSLLRNITRGLRDLSYVDLERSERASKKLSALSFRNFSFMPEECFYAGDMNFNFIKRTMPEGDKDFFPWFYAISSQEFGKEFELNCASQVIKSWMFFASKNLLLEYHTQNILFDQNSSLCYRDLSDVRSDTDIYLRPSFANGLKNRGELLALVFDRTVCNQNLDHLFRYSKKLNETDRKSIKELIESEISFYNLPFPNYSMDFPPDSAERIPQKTNLVGWRNFR